MKRRNEEEEEMVCRKKARISNDSSSDLFDTLPDHVVVSILAKLSSSAASPQDFINVLLTCTRLNRLAQEPAVLKEVGMKTVAVRAKNWSESADRFLRQCVRAGSNEATYFLGMILFYCADSVQSRNIGASLIAKAAIRNHVLSLYSLAIIQFNGSGAPKDKMDLRAGLALCARAGDLGHIDSMLELGYCYQDGYGVRKNRSEARSLITQAAAQEVACSIRASPKEVQSKCETQLKTILSLKTVPGANPGLGHAFWSSGSGLQFSRREKLPANRFLIEWFEMKGSGMKKCSNEICGRGESRENEFRRCSGCGMVRYCSRGCQAYDWKVSHRFECSPMPQLVHHAVDEEEDYQEIEIQED